MVSVLKYSYESHLRDFRNAHPEFFTKDNNQIKNIKIIRVFYYRNITNGYDE